jgi:murein DD-endopeptidase MepM/ murein hydrolase activator NlpD
MTQVHFPTIPNAIVTQKFGNHNPDLYGQANPTHKGIDYGVLPNNVIRACMSGIVHTAINQQTGYGRHVRLVHPDGSMSIYGHLNSIAVQRGDTVVAGQEIGRSGGDPNDGVDGDGLSTGAHLHWEIRPPDMHGSDRHAVDPMWWCLQHVSATVRIATVTAASGLNVRILPTATSQRVDTLRRGDTISIIEERDGWGRINSLRPEWVSLAYVNFTGAVVEIVPPDTAVPLPPELTDAEKLARLWNAHPELW